MYYIHLAPSSEIEKLNYRKKVTIDYFFIFFTKREWEKDFIAFIIIFFDFHCNTNGIHVHIRFIDTISNKMNTNKTI